MHSSPSVRGDALYDVVVLGLDRSPAEVADGLQRVFGLDEATALALLSSLPATVCHQVNEIRAQYFMRALNGIGARVALRSEQPVEMRHNPTPANDVAPPSAAVNTPSTRAATLLMGSDPLAATLNALPAPQLRAAEPPARVSAAAARTKLESLPVVARAVHGDTLPHEATLPKAALVPEPEGAAPRWGELVRESPKHRPASQPLAPQPAQSESYGELSLPAPGQALPLVSLQPVSVPGRERIAAAPAPGRAAVARDAHKPINLRETPARAQAGVAPKRAAVAAAVPKGCPRPSGNDQEVSFWAELPELLTFPWRQRGLHWFISIGIWALCANLLAALAKAVPLAGTSFIFMMNSSVLALCADYHRRCMWAVLNAEGPLEDGPDFDPARILHTYMRSGLHLIVFMLVSQLPLTAWVVNSLVADDIDSALQLVLSRRFWLLACVPSLYWPMAVATASLYNRFQGIWYVPVGLRALLRAPLEYACITVIGCVAFLVPWLVCTAIGQKAGLPEVFFVAVAGLPLAASHALMGTLTGQLMRARPQLFESAAD